MAIEHFADGRTEKLWVGQFIKKWHPDLQRAARVSLAALDAAETLTDLEVPPGNKLEKLKGNRDGQYSIRVNDQWRTT